MKNIILISISSIILSACVWAEGIDGMLTGGRITSHVNQQLNYDDNLSRLLQECLRSNHTNTAFCEKMNYQFKQDRPSWNVIRATMLCTKKDGYDKFDACYAMSQRSQ